MNKNELIRETANNAGITIKEATTAFDAVVKAITDGLKMVRRFRFPVSVLSKSKKNPKETGSIPRRAKK